MLAVAATEHIVLILSGTDAGSGACRKPKLIIEVNSRRSRSGIVSKSVVWSTGPA